MSASGQPDQARRRELTRAAMSAWMEARELLFVCLGNICRSPFAERLARAHLDADRTVTSAGTYPLPGRRCPKTAIAAARPFWVELGDHRSRVLSTEMLRHADVVFVFDHANYRAVVSEHPASAPAVHLLGALSEEGPLTISDPYGGSAGAFELIYRQIAAAIEAAGPD